jgi:hypothetical protein
MVRLKDALGTNIAAALTVWESLSAGSGLDGTEVADLGEIPAARIYLYDFPTSGVAGYPCVVFRHGVETDDPRGAPNTIPGYAEHEFEVLVFVADSDLLTAWRRLHRVTRAVADTLVAHGQDAGNATDNTGIPYYVRVPSISYGDVERDPQNGMVIGALLTVVAKEKVKRSYASI